MYRPKRQENANIARPRHYVEGINTPYDWNVEKKKIKPDNSKFELNILRTGSSIKCRDCKTVLNLPDSFDRREDEKIITDFKNRHHHNENS